MKSAWLSLVFATLVIIVSGCTQQPAADPTPASTSQPTAPQVSATPTQATGPASSASPQGAAPAKQIAERQTRWSESNDETPDSAWVGLNEKNQLVVAGNVIPRGKPSAGFQMSPAKWLADPAVSRVIIRQQVSGQIPSFSILSRERYDQAVAAGAKLTFPSAAWNRGVDFYAEAGTLRPPSPDLAIAQSWLTERLGSRLLEVGIITDGAAVRAVVQADSLSEQQRMDESALLYAGLYAVANAHELQIEYRGAVTVKQIRVTFNLFAAWVQRGADPANLASCLEIDGNDADYAACPGPGSGVSSDSLANLLADRSRMQAALPAGAHLIIGEEGVEPLILVVEGDIPTTQPWEQAWAAYADAVDRLFAQERSVYHMWLILYRGDEVEFNEWTVTDWAIRHYALSRGIKLEPATLQMTGDYFRYKQVKP